MAARLEDVADHDEVPTGSLSEAATIVADIADQEEAVFSTLREELGGHDN